MSLINAFIINCCLEVTPSHHTLCKESRWYLKGYGKRAFQRSKRTSINWAEKLLFPFSFLLFSDSIGEWDMNYSLIYIFQALKCFLVSNFCVVLGNEPGNWIPLVPIKNCANTSISAEQFLDPTRFPWLCS